MRNDERLRTIYEVMAPYIVRNEHNWRDYLAFASQFHTHILLENVPGLAPTSLLLLEQLRTIDRKRLRGYIGRISKEKMLEVDAALAISIGIGYPKRKEDSQCMKMTVVCSLPEMPTD